MAELPCSGSGTSPCNAPFSFTSNDHRIYLASCNKAPLCWSVVRESKGSAGALLCNCSASLPGALLGIYFSKCRGEQHLSEDKSRQQLPLLLFSWTLVPGEPSCPSRFSGILHYLKKQTGHPSYGSCLFARCATLLTPVCK